MSNRPPRIRTNPERQWRQLMQEGGAGGTKTYVMEVAGGCVIQLLCTENGQPISSALQFVPGAKLADFGHSD